MDAIHSARFETPAGPRKATGGAGAVTQNRLFARSLGWGRLLNAITAFLGVTGAIPDERVLAAAVARWQKRNGLRATGVIDARTWAKMRKVLRASLFFKNDPRYQRVPLAPAQQIPIDPRWPAERRTLARTYNRLGGLISALATDLRIDVPAVLAVWQVESGGHVHQTNSALIRFENHKFFDLWGQRNQARYDQHFRHGGRAGLPLPRRDGHAFRVTPASPWLAVHPRRDQQRREHAALSLARRLGGDDAALQSISIGGPQILISNHRMIGYQTPSAMFDAFQASERAHVLGFFDYCRQRVMRNGKDLIDAIRVRDWLTLARGYNGNSPNAPLYAARIQNAYNQARLLPFPPPATPEYGG